MKITVIGELADETTVHNRTRSVECLFCVHFISFSSIKCRKGFPTKPNGTIDCLYFERYGLNTVTKQNCLYCRYWTTSARVYCNKGRNKNAHQGRCPDWIRF